MLTGGIIPVSSRPARYPRVEKLKKSRWPYVKFNPGFVAEVFGVDLEDASDGLTIFGETPRSIRFQMRSINNAIQDGALSVANSLTRTAGLFSYGQLPNAIIDAEDIVRIYRSEIEPSTERLADSLIDFQLLTAGDQAYLQSGNLHPEDEAQVVRHVIASEGSRLSVGDPILEYRPLFTYRTNINVDEIPVNIANAASGAIATATLRCKGPIQVAEAQEDQWQQPLPHSDLKDRVFSIGELSLPVLITVDRLRQIGQFDTAIGDPSTISLIVHIQYENRFFYDGTRRLRIVQSLVAEELICSLFFN